MAHRGIDSLGLLQEVARGASFPSKSRASLAKERMAIHGLNKTSSHRAGLSMIPAKCYIPPGAAE
jgi:hypothetical protein